MEPEENPWKTVDSKEVYRTPWISVTHHNVITPSGKPSIYGTVQFAGIAIGIIPLDEDNNTWIVGQYRFPLKEYCWEIPEGGGDKNVTPLESAKRELLEECGIKADSYELIQEMQVSNSATDEYAYIFVARGLSFHAPQPDDDEQLQIRKLPFEDLYQMVVDGRCKDSLTVAGVLRLKLLMAEGKI